MVGSVLISVGLMLMDSFKLVHRREVMYSILAGVGAAALAFAANYWLLNSAGVDAISTFTLPSIDAGLSAGDTIASSSDGATLRIEAVDPLTGKVTFSAIAHPRSNLHKNSPF